jgi:DNA-binding MarR family transcriptional regulator
VNSLDRHRGLLCSNGCYYIGQRRTGQALVSSLHKRKCLSIRTSSQAVSCVTICAMNLRSFFPYRIALLAEAVSQATAQVYRERFNLTRDEWRVIAALVNAGKVKTAFVLESSTLDKMRVSRAVARLESAGLVERSADPDDGRAYLLQLLPPGLALYRKIVPMVRAREEFLLSALEPAERAVLDTAMDKLLEKAEQLRRQG